MRHINNFSAVIIGGACALGSSNTSAQTFGAEYYTEWQTDFNGNYDWLNLLKTSAEMPLSGCVKIEASTISTAKSGATTLIDDLLTYSNIESYDIPLTLARLGVGMNIGNVELFAGINNVNEDYFTSELTSFFTNSSYGISPTISCNFDIANYPVAAWCLHYRQKSGSVSWQTSLYPGQGYSRILGHDNVFSLNIKDDGIFSITSIDYNRNGIYTVLGIALHHGVCMGDEEGEQTETPVSESKKRLSASPWVIGEFDLPCNLGLIAHASISSVESGCKGYASIGAVYRGKHVQPGVALNYASFSYADEYDVEISSRLPLASDKAYLQPTLHLVSTHHSPLKCIGMLRFFLEI